MKFPTFDHGILPPQPVSEDTNFTDLDLPPVNPDSTDRDLQPVDPQTLPPVDPETEGRSFDDYTLFLKYLSPNPELMCVIDGCTMSATVCVKDPVELRKAALCFKCAKKKLRHLEKNTPARQEYAA
jgi:hypothetical protein